MLAIVIDTRQSQVHRRPYPPFPPSPPPLAACTLLTHAVGGREGLLEHLVDGQEEALLAPVHDHVHGREPVVCRSVGVCVQVGEGCGCEIESVCVRERESKMRKKGMDGLDEVAGLYITSLHPSPSRAPQA